MLTLCGSDCVFHHLQTNYNISVSANVPKELTDCNCASLSVNYGIASAM